MRKNKLIPYTTTYYSFVYEQTFLKPMRRLRTTLLYGFINGVNLQANSTNNDDQATAGLKKHLWLTILSHDARFSLRGHNSAFSNKGD